MSGKTSDCKGVMINSETGTVTIAHFAKNGYPERPRLLITKDEFDI